MIKKLLQFCIALRLPLPESQIIFTYKKNAGIKTLARVLAQLVFGAIGAGLMQSNNRSF